MADGRRGIKAAYTLDLSGPGRAGGRIAVGVLFVVFGLLLAIGSLGLFIASFVVPALFDWFDVIFDFWWLPGGLGLVLLILGFVVARRAWSANPGHAVAQDLAAAGLLDEDSPNPSPPHPPRTPDLPTIT
jgi:hypothetical protein